MRRCGYFRRKKEKLKSNTSGASDRCALLFKKHDCAVLKVWICLRVGYETVLFIRAALVLYKRDRLTTVSVCGFRFLRGGGCGASGENSSVLRKKRISNENMWHFFIKHYFIPFIRLRLLSNCDKIKIILWGQSALSFFPFRKKGLSLSWNVYTLEYPQCG